MTAKRRPSKPGRYLSQEERDLRAAQAREQARNDDRDPANWGPNLAQLRTVHFRDVTLTKNPSDPRRPNLIERALVFDALRRKGTLTQAQANAGHDMVELWAKWKGLAGANDKQEGYVDNSGSVAELVNDRMIIAGRRFNLIAGRVGRANALLLSGLAEDWVMNTGRDWQAAVRSIYPARDANKLSAFVMAACENVRIEIESGALREPLA